MAHCYQCGRQIETERPFQRRRVKTAEYLARRYPQLTIKGWRVNYGLRIVCKWCARRIDKEQARAELWEWIKLALALLTLFLLLVIKS